MARKLRIQYAGAIYHVMNRGDRQEVVFKDEKDHLLFLQTLEQVCEKTGWTVHAWCLMGNHFHMVVETPQPNLVEGMKWFLGSCTARFNRRQLLCRYPVNPVKKDEKRTGFTGFYRISESGCYGLNSHRA